MSTIDSFAERTPRTGRCTEDIVETRSRGSIARNPSRRTSRSSLISRLAPPIRSAPPIYQRSHRITANIVVPDDKTEGVIVATGGGGAGDTLYVKGGKVVYQHNFVDRARYRVVSDIPLPRRRRGHPRPRAETLQAIHREHCRPSDGKPAGEGEIANVTPGRFSATETLDIGMDLGSTISMDYSDQAPFAFTGTIETVRIDLT